MPTAITNHTELLLARRPSRDIGKPNIERFLRACCGQVQVLEAEIMRLLTERWLSSAVGAQLDGLGQILRLARGTLNDTNYRAALYAQVQVITSHGTAPNIKAAVQARTGKVVTVNDLGRASIEVVPAAFLPAPDEVIAIVRAARPVGVDASVIYRMTEYLNECLTMAKGFETDWMGVKDYTPAGSTEITLVGDSLTFPDQGYLILGRDAGDFIPDWECCRYSGKEVVGDDTVFTLVSPTLFDHTDELVEWYPETMGFSDCPEFLEAPLSSIEQDTTEVELADSSLFGGFDGIVEISEGTEEPFFQVEFTNIGYNYITLNTPSPNTYDSPIVRLVELYDGVGGKLVGQRRM